MSASRSAISRSASRRSAARFSALASSRSSLASIQAGLQPHVAVAGERLQLGVDGVGRAVEDDVDDRLGPFQPAPVLDVVVGEPARVRAGAEREQQFRRRASAYANTAGLIANTPPSIERAGAEPDGLEVGRRRRGGVRGVDHADVVGAQEQRLARLEVVDGQQHGRGGVGEPRVAEVAAQDSTSPSES